MTVPPILAEGAPRLALPFGLFSVLTPRPEGDRHWMNGVQWETLTCDPASGIGQPDCIPDERDGSTVAVGLPKNFADGVPVGDATAFTVYGSFKCSPVGNSPEAAQLKANQHLLVREEARVEQALWTGDLSNTPNLGVAYDLTASGAVPPLVALGLLEAYIATEYGSQGVIHIARSDALALAVDGAIKFSGSQATTALGTPVVVGSGYDQAAGPLGAPAAASTGWAYVTPALFGYRSDVTYASNRAGDLLDRATNDLYAIAERHYLIGFDPCGLGAANYTLPGALV